MQLKPGDKHIQISHSAKRAKCFDSDGSAIWEIDALTEGVGGGQDARSGDTPFGDYSATGLVETTSADDAATWAAYGPWFVALDDIEGQERNRGRAGIGMHGGGTGLPDPQAPMQDLWPTLGCIRLHNVDLVGHVVPLVRRTLAAGGRVIVTVGP